MSNVEENYTEESNHHSQISYRSQFLNHFEYKPRQDFESQWINQIQVNKEENKEFSYKKVLIKN